MCTYFRNEYVVTEVHNKKLFASVFHWIRIASKQRETEYENDVCMFITEMSLRWVFFLNEITFDSSFMQSRNFIRGVYSQRIFP
jgi:hypothetical protein